MYSWGKKKHAQKDKEELMRTVGTVFFLSLDSFPLVSGREKEIRKTVLKSGDI